MQRQTTAHITARLKILDLSDEISAVPETSIKSKRQRAQTGACGKFTSLQFGHLFFISVGETIFFGFVRRGESLKRII